MRADRTPGHLTAGRRPVLGRVGRVCNRAALEPWFAPFALVNADAVGLVPILLPIVAVRHGVAHVGLVMGAFSLGAIAAPVAGNLADRYRAYPSLATAFAAPCAPSLSPFPPGRPPAAPPPPLGKRAPGARGLAGAHLLLAPTAPPDRRAD